MQLLAPRFAGDHLGTMKGLPTGRTRPRLLDDPQVGYRDERTVNGRPARIFSGTGTRTGRDFDFVFAVVQIAPKRIAVAAFVGEPGIFDRYEAQLIDLLDSVVAAEAAQ